MLTGGKALFMKAYVRTIRSLLARPGYTLPLLFTALLSYGYSAAHRAMGIDDLIRGMYTKDGLYIGTGRLAGYLTMLLLGKEGSETALQVIAGVLLLLLGAAAACALFRGPSDDPVPVPSCAVFSCLLISFPMNADAWIYADTAFMIRVGYLLAPVSVAFLIDFTERKKLLSLLLSVLCLAWCAGSYEGILPVYVCYCCMCLLLGQVRADRRSDAPGRSLRLALWMVFSLLAAVLVSRALSRLVAILFRIPAWVQPTQSILWMDGSLPVSERFLYLLRNIFSRMVLPGAFSLPFTLLDLAWLISACLLIKATLKRPLAIPAVFGMAVSPLLLSLLNGTLLPFRTCQAAAAFVACTAMLLVLALTRYRKRASLLVNGVFFCAALLCGALTSRLFRTDYAAFLHEQELLRESSAYLERRMPERSEAPVVYVVTDGSPRVSPEEKRLLETGTSNRLYKALYDRISFLPECVEFTEIPNGTLEWAAGASDWFPSHTPQQIMHLHLALAGCDGRALPTESMIAGARGLRAQLEPYPSDRCVLDAGEYLVLDVG